VGQQEEPLVSVHDVTSLGKNLVAVVLIVNNNDTIIINIFKHALLKITAKFLCASSPD